MGGHLLRGRVGVPDCGTESSRVHDTVVTCPKDVRRAGDPVGLNVVKRRLKCENASCGRRTFTERVAGIPPGCRVLPRLKEQCAGEVADRGITPAEAARHAGVSRPVADAAFTARAEEILEPGPEPVVHLGIDEHRRGRPRWRKDEETGRYVTVADRWHVNFCDLSGKQGMLGQVEGRTADDAAYWLLSAPAAWRDRVEVVAIDMCTIFASAVRRALPQARIAVDLFHVVQAAVKALGEVRRRATRANIRAAREERRPRVRAETPAQPQPRRPPAREVRQGHRQPGRRRARPAGPPRVDRQGEAARRAEPPGQDHRIPAARTAGPRPVLRLLRLVRPARGHP